MARGVYILRSTSDRLTLTAALARYLAEVTPLKKPSTQPSNHTAARRLTAEIGSYSLAALTPPVIAAYRDKRLQQVKPDTVRIELALLGHLYTTAIREWGTPLPANPVSLIRKPKPGAARERWRDGAADRGARHLQQPHADMDRAAGDPYRHAQGRDRWLAATGGRSARPHDTTPRHQERRLTDGAAVTDLRFHGLRLEAVSRFVESGMSDQQVMAISGHKSAQMLRRYTHLRNQNLVDVSCIIRVCCAVLRCAARTSRSSLHDSWPHRRLQHLADLLIEKF